MIRENQVLLNRINVAADGLLVFLSFLLGYWIRFDVLNDGIRSVPFEHYCYIALALVPIHLLTYTKIGLYESQRKSRLYQELGSLIWANTLDMVILQMLLFLFKNVHVSRLSLAFFFVAVNLLIGLKKTITHKCLYYYRRHGFNLKTVLLVGGGEMAQIYVEQLRRNPSLGYRIGGYLSSQENLTGEKHLGSLDQLESLLDSLRPDEVVACLDGDQQEQLPTIIQSCDKHGIKLSLVPFYAKYISSNPQFDSLNGLPMINVRRIPLDNLGNAFVKRTVDIVGSLVLIVLSSPLMLMAVIGVKLSSPGPIIFAQKRVGRNNKDFYMYKFRSMKVNSSQNTGWSTNSDDRKTKFGSFIRKFSIDELPQFFNVLKGDMSLVGPRPELPFFVNQFKDEVPRYMVKHQVRPGITGWAQVHGFRGDTSIPERIRHDIYYIENWSLSLDIKILFMTLTRFMNPEELI